jgi:K+-transporting ATPase ATPase C chain
MNIASTLKPAFLITLLFTLLCGIVYPCFMWGVGQLFFHREAKGSLLYSEKEQLIGSTLLAQSFTSPRYFHPRPSLAGSGYDALHSSASNLGSTSQKLFDILKQRAAAYRLENRLSPQFPIPSDAITASGSGLDPHISVENANIQAARVAAARGVPLEQVQQLIEDATEGRFLSILGMERINVLLLNLKLDQL